MERRVFYKPVYLPVVWCPDNSDGSYSWPSTIKGAWIVIRTLADLPRRYLRPPRVETSKAEMGGD